MINMSSHSDRSNVSFRKPVTVEQPEGGGRGRPRKVVAPVLDQLRQQTQTYGLLGTSVRDGKVRQAHHPAGPLTSTPRRPELGRVFGC